MQMKSEVTQRERKLTKRIKNNDSTGKYSSKHIRNYEEMQKWKKVNNSKQGSKSRHHAKM